MPRIVTFGEIMLRLSPPGWKRFSQASSFDAIYAGGESNVAFSLANFGLDTRFVTRIPENDIGACALNALNSCGVDTNHVIRGGERLGIYFLETGAMQRGAKVVYDRAYSSMTTIMPGQIDWEAAFEDVDWFHWTGVTPGLSQSAADACLEACKAAADRGITISSDPNYRKALWKYGKSPAEVLPALVEYSDIVISSKFDAETLFDIPFEEEGLWNKNPDSRTSYSAVGKAVMQRFPKVKKVISTSRGSISASHNTWSAMLWDGKQIHTSPTYELSHIVDRVGGGDSFMAGLIYGFLTWPQEDPMALRFAVAASALKHSVSGDTNLATVDEVMSLLHGDGSGRVSR